MSTARNILAIRDVYRDDATAAGWIWRAAAGHLAAANDALSMALLTLGGECSDRGDKMRRAEQGRAFMVEAVTALSRARIYLPKIRTHSLPVLMSCERDPDAELARLHRIATRLLWQNHAHLPAKLQAKPLAPEEEAQLAVVLRDLARHARIDRALRFKWVLGAFALVVAGSVLGFPLWCAAAATSAAALALWQFLRDNGRPTLPSATA
jgi:hypothetical protein